MAALLSMLALALAVSLDGLGAGMMYGLRNIRIPLSSILIVSVCSGIVLFGSMAVGAVFAGWLPPAAAKWVGALILIAIGVWAIVQGFLTSRREQESSAEEPRDQEEDRTILHWEIRQLGLIIRIWKTPSAADMDRSGVITASEALLLGIALSLDSLGAGIGAALIGLPPVATALVVGASSGLCIAVGAKLGTLLSGWRWAQQLSMIPGCILITMGIVKLM